LRKWPPDNESPDPKKNFIKKHQEEQEKLHLEAIANSPKPAAPGPPAPAAKDVPASAPVAPVTLAKVEKVTEDNSKHRNGENVENSLFENLGYNSGDDVSKYSDDHLNKQLIVKPSTVLAKDGSEDEENATKAEEPPKLSEEIVVKQAEEMKVEEEPPKVDEAKAEESTTMEHKKPD
jgi:hypothetical protein